MTLEKEAVIAALREVLRTTESEYTYKTLFRIMHEIELGDSCPICSSKPPQKGSL